MSKSGSDEQSTTDSRQRVDAAQDDAADRVRRHFLVTAVATVGAIGAALAAWPFIASWRPSAKAKALGGPVRVDLSNIAPGEQATVIWRGKPIWVLRRTPEMLERMQNPHWISDLRDPDSRIESQQPSYAQNATRSVTPDIFVAVALCTHLGCVPLFHPEVPDEDLGKDWVGGYFCPCHGSKFDLAGRVTKNVPAPTNLVVPPYRFVSADVVEIGVDNA